MNTPLPPVVNRTKAINFRVSPEEFEDMITAVATVASRHKYPISLSAWIRRVVKAECDLILVPGVDAEEAP